MPQKDKYKKTIKQVTSARSFGTIASIFTGRNEVVAKVIFLHLSVIHSVHRGGGKGVCLSACWDTTLPRDQTPPPPRPPGSRHHHPPGPDTHPLGADTPPPGSRHPPRSRPPQEQTPPGSRLQHTVYERPVRILLECILVYE